MLCLIVPNVSPALGRVLHHSQGRCRPSIQRGFLIWGEGLSELVLCRPLEARDFHQGRAADRANTLEEGIDGPVAAAGLFQLGAQP